MVNVAVLNRVVVYVVYSRPKVPMRFNRSIYAIEPNLSAALILLAVPGVRGTPMQQAQLVSQCFDVFGSQKHVIVIRQNAPGISAGGKLFASRKQISLEARQSFMVRADMVFVLEAGSRNEELPRPFEFHVGRRVQRTLTQTAVFNSFSLLLQGHFAIVVHRTRTLENRRTEYNL